MCNGLVRVTRNIQHKRIYYNIHTAVRVLSFLDFCGLFPGIEEV